MNQITYSMDDYVLRVETPTSSAMFYFSFSMLTLHCLAIDYTRDEKYTLCKMLYFYTFGDTSLLEILNLLNLRTTKANREVMLTTVKSILRDVAAKYLLIAIKTIGL